MAQGHSSGRARIYFTSRIASTSILTVRAPRASRTSLLIWIPRGARPPGNPVTQILRPCGMWLVCRLCTMTEDGAAPLLSRSLTVWSWLRFSPHTARHYYAQTYLRYGLAVYSLSCLLGREDHRHRQWR